MPDKDDLQNKDKTASDKLEESLKEGSGKSAHEMEDEESDTGGEKSTNPAKKDGDK